MPIRTRIIIALPTTIPAIEETLILPARPEFVDCTVEVEEVEGPASDVDDDRKMEVDICVVGVDVGIVGLPGIDHEPQEERAKPGAP